MVNLQDLKNSLRITHELDDTLLQHYLDTATEYVIQAVNGNVGSDEYGKYKQFDFAVSLLTQYWYNNRNAAIKSQIPVEVLAMIQQLRGRLA